MIIPFHLMLAGHPIDAHFGRGHGAIVGALPLPAHPSTPRTRQVRVIDMDEALLGLSVSVSVIIIPI